MTSRVTPLREPNPELLAHPALQHRSRASPSRRDPDQQLGLSAGLGISPAGAFRQCRAWPDLRGNRQAAGRGQIANPVTLKNLFDQDGALTEIGGAQYLARLAAAAATIIDAEDYGRAVHDLYLRRELITVGEDVVNDAFRQDLDDPAREQIERAEKKLFDLAVSGEAEGGFRVFEHCADQRDP